VAKRTSWLGWLEHSVIAPPLEVRQALFAPTCKNAVGLLTDAQMVWILSGAFVFRKRFRCVNVTPVAKT
jgi:hypothetical protein